MTSNDTAIVATIRDRDQVLTFVIRMMAPFEHEQWLLRALRLRVNNADAVEADYLEAVEVLIKNGPMALIMTGDNGAFALMDALLDCCFLVTGKGEEPCTRDLRDETVQDVRTLMALKKLAMKHNMSAISPEGVSSLPPAFLGRDICEYMEGRRHE